MAELIATIMPSMEVIRMVSSGTEAVMSAIRVARDYTNREYIIKFRGCLQFLRRITKEYGALLIFDEVITGFRLSCGGAQGVLQTHGGEYETDCPGCSQNLW